VARLRQGRQSRWKDGFSVRLQKKYRKNGETFGSCPLRSKTLVFLGFFACLANCFGFPAYPCLSMPAGAALDPGESSSESSESPRNPRFYREKRWLCSRGGRIRISCLRNKKDRTERSHRSSNRPTNTTRSQVEVLLAKPKPGQTGK
jgi:hypothetical protein